MRCKDRSPQEPCRSADGVHPWATAMASRVSTLSTRTIVRPHHVGFKCGARVTVDQRVPSVEGPEPRWGLASTRVKPRGVEKVMASGIARTAKVTALMWCLMQAPSPPDALEEEGRRQGERRASYQILSTPLAHLALPPGVCDFGGPVVSSVAMVATSCRRLRPSGWASATRRWRAVSVRRSRRPPHWAVPPWCAPAPR